MEIVQEMGRSYLIIEDRTPKEMTFMQQMLIYNRIPGVVACEKGLYDNRAVLKYDITNMKPISKAYETGELSYNKLRELMCEINQTIAGGRAFLFDDDRYLMMPENIYLNLEDERIYLIYIPFDMGKSPIAELNGRLYELADFLIDRVNHKDESAVSIAYQFYRMSKSEFFSMDAFAGIIEKENNAHIFEKKHDEVKQTIGRLPMAEQENEEEDDEYNIEDNGTKIRIVPVIICLSAMALIGILPILLPQTKKYLNQIIIVEAVLGGAIIIYVIFRLIKKRLDENYDDLILDEKITLEEFWSYDGETQFFDDDHTEILDSDATQFFDTEIPVKHIITWEEDGNKRTREIKKEDNILGKKFDEVDLCISDPSISRRHARIIIGKKGSFLQDLDSTNGTFVNGNRLMPGENVKIDETSEIRFGKVTVSVV